MTGKATTEDQGLANPRLAEYAPGERRAILVHKYFLGIEMGHDPGLEWAIQSWESRFGPQWRRGRHMDDCRQQMDQIERHRDWLAQQAGHEVSWEQAARDWISHCAAEWRSCHQF